MPFNRVSLTCRDLVSFLETVQTPILAERYSSYPVEISRVSALKIMSTWRTPDFVVARS